MMFRQALARFGLAPIFAVAALGVAQAQPASTGGGGQMAYPDSLPSGQVRIPGSTARDTGNMAYPSSPGGIATSAESRSTKMPMHGRSAMTGPASAPASAMPAGQAGSEPMPTPQGMAAARALNTAPGSQPVPYVDFGSASEKSGAMHHTATMHHAGTMHHAKKMAKKPAA